MAKKTPEENRQASIKRWCELHNLCKHIYETTGDESAKIKMEQIKHTLERLQKRLTEYD